MTTTTASKPVVAPERPNVGIRCPHGCGFVAVRPTLRGPGGVPVSGDCPKCGKPVPLS